MFPYLYFGLRQNFGISALFVLDFFLFYQFFLFGFCRFFIAVFFSLYLLHCPIDKCPCKCNRAQDDHHFDLKLEYFFHTKNMDLDLSIFASQIPYAGQIFTAFELE